MVHLIMLILLILTQLSETCMRTENILCDLGGRLRGLWRSLRRCH